MNTLCVEKTNLYLSQLNNLHTYTTNAETGNSISNEEKENIGKTIFSFLTSFDSGIAYKDGLKYAAYLISRLNISCEDYPLPQIKNEKKFEIRIIIWLVSQNSQKVSITLTKPDITFCNSHPFWNNIFIEGLKRWPETGSVSGEILFGFIPLADNYQSYIFLAGTFQNRGGITQSSDILKRGLSTARPKTVLRYQVIRELRNNGLKDESETLTKEALLFNQAEIDADEFINICKTAREQGLFEESLRATVRFLAKDNGNLSDDQQFSLNSILLEEFLKHGVSGFYAGIQLYKRYRSRILKQAEIPSFFPNLVVAAQKLGYNDIIQDVADKCKDHEIPEKPEWWRLKAEVLEFSNDWVDAYSFWQKLHEQKPGNSEIIFRIIENRLVCYDENSADRFVKKLADQNDPSLKTFVFSYQILSNISSPTQIIEIARKNREIFERDNPLFERILLEYSEALCTQFEWTELEKVQGVKGSQSFMWKKFFVDLAKIMNFVHAIETQRQPGISADEVISISRQLISSPISTDQILILLNVDLIDKIKKALLKNDRNFSPFIEELSEEMELRVALEVESIIMNLEKRNVDTHDYRKRLREMTLGLGSRQLLEDLERESRSIVVGV
jgi:tetratricopeptide (TPR) repeat protein